MVASPHKGRKAKPSQQRDEVVQFWHGAEGKERLLRLLYCLIRVKVLNSETGAKVNAAIRYLWVPDVIDKRLLECILSTLAKVLESPETARAHGRHLLTETFSIYRELCVHFGEAESVCDSLMLLAFHLEAFQQPNCSGFHFIDGILGAEKNEGELQPLLSLMISYVSSIDVQSFKARGESSSRVMCLFITTLAEKCPQFLYSHLAYIVPFLSFDVSLS
jgi:hypothetical protein